MDQFIPVVGIVALLGAAQGMRWVRQQWLQTRQPLAASQSSEVAPTRPDLREPP